MVGTLYCLLQHCLSDNVLCQGSVCFSLCILVREATNILQVVQPVSMQFASNVIGGRVHNLNLGTHRSIGTRYTCHGAGNQYEHAKQCCGEHSR